MSIVGLAGGKSSGFGERGMLDVYVLSLGAAEDDSKTSLVSVSGAVLATSIGTAR